MKSIFTKIFSLNLLFLVIALMFMFIFANFLYEQLYVHDIEDNMREVGTELQSLYTGGDVSDELIELVQHHSQFLNYDVFAVRDPKDLSACLPFEMDHGSIIGPNERQQLIAGEVVVNVGYEEMFDKRVLSVVHPLVDNQRLEGIIYQYYPIEDIAVVAQKGLSITIVGAVLFMLLAAIISYIVIRKMVAPIIALRQAVQKMKDGRYDTRVTLVSKDEIGALGQAFNDMAHAIEQEDERQREFLATVSHELRTPLSYIAGYAEGIEKGIVQDEQHVWSIIRSETKRMQKLTSELLQLTAQQTRTIEHEPVIMAEVLRQAVDVLSLKLEQKKLIVTLHIDEDWIVRGDAFLLEQVCINLLENAIRYTECGRTITVETSIAKTAGTLTIADEGIGIAPEHVPHITERFYRVNNARSTADGGTGLGLAIVKQIVDAHEGTLHIASKQGEGTSVHITLQNYDE
ncbi:sensor histidine kinase [Caryophanon latum]|uniref:histidine kinase n=1 Tax=Caryophanon latum TaxID=33977 RepID=A0A1C0Z227_9BACL|nr:HAMP domain-containing sensor histidine kinase [Caryophanon latum]OCS93472.1 hypothetical protein A6K76_05390 [Caryophanon latum]